jgi:hypothetical protein
MWTGGFFQQSDIPKGIKLNVFGEGALSLCVRGRKMW